MIFFSGNIIKYNKRQSFCSIYIDCTCKYEEIFSFCLIINFVFLLIDSEELTMGTIKFVTFDSQVEYVRRETTGIYRKSPERGSNIPLGKFRNFPGVFLRDTVIFPTFSCRFLQYPFSEIIDLGLGGDPIQGNRT